MGFIDHIFMDDLLSLARISHEHCVNLFNCKQFLYVERSHMELQIYTMFTKGQSIRRHFLQYFGSEYRLLSESTLTRSLRLPIHSQKL
jgi:hypothetical protein